MAIQRGNAICKSVAQKKNLLGKVNSVKEAGAKCFAVHYQNLKSCKPHE
jgi:hypothetical protein